MIKTCYLLCLYSNAQKLLYQQLEALLYNTRRYYKDVERDRGNKELESKGDIYVRCFK